MDEETIKKLYEKFVKGKRLTRGRAIKLYCKELCCAGDNESWRSCSQKRCFLWNFRMGKETIPKNEVPKKFINKTNGFKQKTPIVEEGCNEIVTKKLKGGMI